MKAVEVVIPNVHERVPYRADRVDLSDGVLILTDGDETTYVKDWICATVKEVAS